VAQQLSREGRPPSTPEEARAIDVTRIVEEGSAQGFSEERIRRLVARYDELVAAGQLGFGAVARMVPPSTDDAAGAQDPVTKYVDVPLTLAERIRGEYPDAYANVNDQQLEEAVVRRLDSERQALRDDRVEHVQTTLMFWVIPPVFLYAFGWSAGWIRRGFRQ
jgi:hypothetical protein